MKTERRQELRTNELGAFLLDANDWARKHASRLVGGAIVVVVAVLAIRSMQMSRADSTDAAVVTMLALSFAEGDADASFATLDGIIADTPDPDVKMAALLRKGASGLNSARATDSDPTPYLDRAEQAFEQLRISYPQRMPVVALALGSLATVEANRFVIDHDLAHREVAESHLKQLQNDPLFKGSPFQTDATERLMQLDDVFQVIVLAEALPLPPASPADAANTPPGTIIAPPGVQVQRLGGPPPGAPVQQEAPATPSPTDTPPADDASGDESATADQPGA